MKRKRRILIVEDEPAMLRALRDNFLHEGYEVALAADGEKALDAALEHPPELILLDVMLPKINGYEVCRLLREHGLPAAIVMLTAKGQEQEIVLGLRAGADDYITKPFGLQELFARCEAVLRRAAPVEDDAYRFGGFTLDTRTKQLARDGRIIELTPKEYHLLEFLLQHTGRVHTRQQLLDAVWGYNVFVTGRSVDRCVNTLRNKIEEDSRRPQFLKTVREIGYRFELTADCGGSGP